MIAKLAGARRLAAGLDRSFTNELPVKAASRAAVASIMTLARGLNLQVTAEGVETEEQLEYPRGQGVDLVQGYLLGKPAPSGALDSGVCFKSVFLGT